MANSEWDERSQRIMEDTRSTMERTSASLSRSNQYAIESEQVGTEILSELGEQRESLLRSQNRLLNANTNLSKSAIAIRSIQRNVLYNKIVLILIIVFEILILAGLIALKFIK